MRQKARIIHSPVVHRREAMKNPTRHQFIPGMGHVAHADEPEIPASYPVGTKNCLPAPDAADGSVHSMKPSHGAAAMRMRWLASHNAWASMKPTHGNRMAWSADYLSRAGWEYISPSAEK